jgi:hypothetical protein
MHLPANRIEAATRVNSEGIPARRVMLLHTEDASDDAVLAPVKIHAHFVQESINVPMQNWIV